MTQLLDPGGTRTSAHFALFEELCVRGYLAVKALEHDHYLNEVSAWERRYLLPQV